MLLLVYAHPHPTRSRANRVLLEAVRGLPAVGVRVLYDLYPDFDLDANAEREAVQQARTIVLQHPLYWYHVPPLAKLWMDEVFVTGWAYGPGGRAVAGKRFLWAPTTGGDAADYSSAGAHEHDFETFVPPMRQFAHYCGMEWLPPFVLLGAHRLDATALDLQAQAYRDRLLALAPED
jgi:glutathione-regulated potassium-efflux system ancillary protein KefF